MKFVALLLLTVIVCVSSAGSHCVSVACFV